MRNGWFKTLGAVAIVVLIGGIAFAEAPIFIDVPSVIQLGGNDGFDNTDVLGGTLDSHAYNPVSPGTAMTWTFTDTYLAAGIITINAVNSGAGDFNSASAVMNVSDTGDNTNGTAGTNAILAAAYAGTTAASLINTTGGSENTATTISVAIANGTATTRKTILVVSVPSTDSDSGSVYKEVGKYGDGAAYTSFTFSHQEFDGTTVEVTEASNDTGGYCLSSDVDDVGDVSLGSINSFNTIQDPVVDDGLGVDIDEGKIYRVTTHVKAVGATSNDTVQRFRIYVGNRDKQHILGGLEVSPNVYTPFGRGNPKFTPYNDGASGAVGRDYEVLFAPPQNRNLDGSVYGTGVKLMVKYDLLDVGAEGVWKYENNGDLCFSNTRIDAIDQPAVGANGPLLVKWPDSTQFTDPAVGSGDGDGWNEAAVQGIAGVAMATTNNTATAGSLALTSSLTGGAIVSFSNGDVQSTPDLDNSSSIIPVSLIQTMSDAVYYRAALRITGSSSDVADNPTMRVRFGLPWGIYAAELSVAAGTTVGYPGGVAGPIDTATTYEVMLKGPNVSDMSTEANNLDFNNLSMNVEMIDVDGDVGATWTVDSLSIEALVL